MTDPMDTSEMRHLVLPFGRAGAAALALLLAACTPAPSPSANPSAQPSLANRSRRRFRRDPDHQDPDRNLGGDTAG